ADPNLWGDPERGQAVTRRLSYLEGELGRLAQLHQRLDDTRVMFELADQEDDEPTRHEAARDLAALRKEIDQLEIRTLLSGEYDDQIDIPEDEIRVDVYRSSGPGGQGVNTTDSAVRLTHLLTGIVVSCQNERSQMQNKATAMAVLKAKLLERKREEQEAKMAN